MTHPVWPLFDLEIRTPRLTLRYVDDSLACRLALLALEGVHDPDEMPFLVPWTDVPSPLQERGSMQFYWSERAALGPRHWSIPFATIVDGEVLGMQGVTADDFVTLRTVKTGSWLVQRAHGRGIGTEMRSAVLWFAFEVLGAQRALTAANATNGPSNGVTRKLGYEPNGSSWAAPRGTSVAQNNYVLPRERWREREPRDDIEVHGFDACRALLGLQGPVSADD